jgi:integrase
LAINLSIILARLTLMGSLRQRSEGVWQARVYAGLDPLSGKRRYAARTIHARNEAEAARELRRLERSVAAGKHPKGTTAITLGDQLHDYLKMKLPRLSPGSRPSYRAAVEIGAKPLHDVPLGKLTARDLDSLYAALEAQGKASATIRRVHNVISAALAQAVRHGLLTVNVAKDADPPPVRTKPTRPPTSDELAKLINSTDEDFKAFLIVAATTGARRGELGALRWRNVDLDGGTMTISASLSVDGTEKDTKTHQARALALDPQTVDVLRAHHKRASELAEGCGSPVSGNRFVFSPRPGSDQPWTLKALTRKFIRLCEATTITGVRLHDLRHFNGSQLIAAGVDVLTVSRRLGHARPSITTDVYGHKVQEHDREAAAVIGDVVSTATSA